MQFFLTGRLFLPSTSHRSTPLSSGSPFVYRNAFYSHVAFSFIYGIQKYVSESHRSQRCHRKCMLRIYRCVKCMLRIYQCVKCMLRIYRCVKCMLRIYRCVKLCYAYIDVWNVCYAYIDVWNVCYAYINVWMDDYKITHKWTITIRKCSAAQVRLHDNLSYILKLFRCAVRSCRQQQCMYYREQMNWQGYGNTCSRCIFNTPAFCKGTTCKKKVQSINLCPLSRHYLHQRMTHALD
jgi:hypothetical protein